MSTKTTSQPEQGHSAATTTTIKMTVTVDCESGPRKCSSSSSSSNHAQKKSSRKWNSWSALAGHRRRNSHNNNETEVTSSTPLTAIIPTTVCARKSIITMAILCVYVYCTGRSLLSIALAMTNQDDNTRLQQQQQQQTKSLSSTSSSPPQSPRTRILVGIVAYDLNQIDYVETMMDALIDTCMAPTVEKVDVHIYTTRAWPVDLLTKWGHGGSRNLLPCGGTIDIHLKSPSWKIQLVDFPRELFYERLDDYDLFIYTEDDHLIQPRHIFGFLEETEKLKAVLSSSSTSSSESKSFFDYSIGFLRFEWDNTLLSNHQLSSSKARKMIWEHQWDLSSVDAFRRKHIKSIPSSIGSSGTIDSNSSTAEQDFYFNGGGSCHQGFFMATSEQLQNWQNRPPNCHFNSSWNLGPRYAHREHVSSIHLFSRAGCNVTQLIPARGFQNFLVFHLSNKQWDVLHREVKPQYKPVSVDESELSWYLRESTKVNSTTTASSSHSSDQERQQQPNQTLSPAATATAARMFDDEKDKQRRKNFDPNLTEYKSYFNINISAS